MEPARKEVIHDISTKAILKVIALFALCAVLYYLKDIVLIVLVAAVIAAAIEPSTKWLIRHRIPRVPAVIMEYLLLALSLSLIFYFLVIPIIGEAVNFLQTLPAYLQSAGVASSITDAGTAVGASTTLSGAFSVQNIVSQLNSAVADLSQGFFSTLLTIFGGAFSFLLIVVLSLYLSVQERGIAHFLSVITPAQQRPYILSLWDKSEVKIGRWMQGQLMLGAIIFVADYIGLLSFGVPHALLLAFLAGLFEIIPVVGPILSAIPGIFLAFVSGGLTFAIIVAAFYTMVQQLESQIIYPLVVKKVVGVPPLISIVALLAGGELLGFLGIVISVPVAAILMEFMNDMQKKEVDTEVPAL
jgi:predicted PurR-regulated permease PerM